MGLDELVMAAREALGTGVAMDLGGGSHHAGRDFAGGYCLRGVSAPNGYRTPAEGCCGS
jgi:hypothetical protein